MRKITLIALLFVSAISFGQTSKTCRNCPPSPSGHNGECLQVNGAGQLQWLPCDSSTGGNFWSTTGNSGTTAGTNFIGTTDKDTLVFKVGGVVSGFYDIGLQNFSVGAYNFSSLSTGENNSAFGVSALPSVTSGNENTAIGHASLASVESGSNNIGIGNQADVTSPSTNYSCAIGYAAHANSYQMALSDSFLSIKMNLNGAGVGKVLVSNNSNLAVWGVTAFTQSDSATIYATTPAVGTTYMCTDCSGSGITGRIVSYYGAAWRRIPVSTLIN